MEIVEVLSTFTQLSQLGVRHDSVSSAKLVGQAFGERCMKACPALRRVTILVPAMDGRSDTSFSMFSGSTELKLDSLTYLTESSWRDIHCCLTESF